MTTATYRIVAPLLWLLYTCDHTVYIVYTVYIVDDVYAVYVVCDYVIVYCIYVYTCIIYTVYMTITNVPYSYKSYAYHIRIREDKWNAAIMFMWSRFPTNPCYEWRTIATKEIAVNDRALAVELTLRFG